MINPIVDWTDEDVWEFLHHYGCESNPLYGEGLRRIGCIGCPMSNYRQRIWGLERWPTYKRAYIHAFDKMLKARLESGKENQENWKDGEAVYRWWIGEDLRKER